MAKQEPTQHQRAVYQSRRKALTQVWEGRKQSLLIGGHRPSWPQAGLGLLMVVLGLGLLGLSAYLFLAGPALPVLLPVIGFALVGVGLDFAVRHCVGAWRYRAAERAHERKLAAVRIEDCPRHAPPVRRRPSAEEERAARYLLGDE